MDVDFTITKAWTVLFGPSGSGKSSLLRLIAGLWTPPDASVRFAGDDLTNTPTHLRQIGFVAQDPALFPHLDVLANVRFGCLSESDAHVDALLRLFYLQDLRRARIARLSGGERQRVALARALAAQPRLLLLDEVFTGMHLPQRDDLLGRVKNHCGQNGMPVLSVTHDAVEASLAGSEILKLEDGKIIARGAAKDVLAGERRRLRSALAEG